MIVDHTQATPCRKCKHPILFVPTGKMKEDGITPVLMPVDAGLYIAKVDEPGKVLVDSNGKTIRGIKAGQVGHEPHWGHCSNPEAFRQKKTPLQELKERK
jgi:hypothetical protein